MLTCIIASHQRSQILIETIGMLNRQTIPPDYIVIVGSRTEQRVARKTGSIFVECPNLPLSVKWQEGVYKAQDLGSDAILIVGSDSWLSSRWIECCLPALDEFDYVGRISGYKCAIHPDEQIEIIQTQITKKRQENSKKHHGFIPPLGAGRLISKRILDKINWYLFQGELNKGLDGLSSRSMTAKGATSSLMLNAPIHLMGIKGPWPALTKYSVIKHSNLTEKMDIIPFENAADWLEFYFPGSIKALERVVPDAILPKIAGIKV